MHRIIWGCFKRCSHHFLCIVGQIYSLPASLLLLRAQGKVLTVCMTPLAHSFLMNLFGQPLVQEKPREEETEEKATIARTKL